MDQTVLILGGLGKLGQSIVAKYVKEGIHVSIVTRTKPSSLPDFFSHYESFISLYITDITCPVEFNSLLSSIVETHTIISVVNAAVHRPNKHLTASSYKSWCDSILVNSLLLFVPTDSIIEYWTSNNLPGSVVVLSSIYGIVAPSFHLYEGTTYTTEPDYAYNKYASIGYIKYNASKYGSYGIRFNIISPGGVFNNQEQVFLDNYSKLVPLGRLATGKEVADSCFFLTSDQSSYITGSVLSVDGGWTSI